MSITFLLDGERIACSSWTGYLVDLYGGVKPPRIIYDSPLSSSSSFFLMRKRERFIVSEDKGPFPEGCTERQSFDSAPEVSPVSIYRYIRIVANDLWKGDKNIILIKSISRGRRYRKARAPRSRWFDVVSLPSHSKRGENWSMAGGTRKKR